MNASHSWARRGVSAPSPVRGPFARLAILLGVAVLLLGLGPAASYAGPVVTPLNASIRFAWQNPAPQGNPLSAVDFVSDSIGWAVGDNGTVIKTTDGGVSWTQQGPIVPQGASDRDTGVWDVCFVDASTGYIAADGAVYKTSNGGATWAATNAWASTGGPYITYLSADFSDANNGWLVGSYNVWRTTDGGTNVAQQVLPVGTYPTQVSAADSVSAYMAGLFEGYLKTADGGATWQQYAYTGTDHVGDWTGSIAAVNAGKVYAVTGGDVLLTTNGGSTWTTMTVGNSPSDPVVAVYLSDADLTGSTAFAVTEGEKLYKTTDSGATVWTYCATVAGISNFDAPTASTVYAIAASRLIASGTGGTSFAPCSQGSATPFSAVDFTSETTGYAAGGYELSRTSDGGASWVTDDLSGKNLMINDVFFLPSNPSLGWLVGSPGTGGPSVLRTTDAGTTWAEQPTASGLVGERVFFTDQDHGWLVNDAWGGFWSTTDGGASWTKTDHPGYFRDIDFVDANNGWIAFSVDDGVDRLFHTTDGGSTWTTQTAGTSGGELIAVDFLDASTGYAVHSFDGLYKTTNGGASWTPVAVSKWAPTFDLVDLKFTSATDGWVIGQQRTSTAGPTYRHDFAAHTTDGGATWDFELSPAETDGGSTGSTCYVTAIDSVGANTWIVGGNGGILKSRPYTITPPVVTPPAQPVAVSLGTPRVSGKASAKKGTKLVGSLAPGHVTKVTLEVQVLSKRKYKKYKKYYVNTTQSGSWSYKVKLRRGTYRVRALTASDGTYLAGSSGWRKITVK